MPKGLIRILDRDLRMAGIEKRDDRGRTLDFHALRHTFGTLISKGRVMPRTAQAAMRHSKIDLTMNVYTDPRLLDVRGALDSLPSLRLEGDSRERATGMDTGALAPTFDQRGISLSFPVNVSSVNGRPEGKRLPAVSGEDVNEKGPLSTPDSDPSEGWVRGLEPPTFRITVWKRLSVSTMPVVTSGVSTRHLVGNLVVRSANPLSCRSRSMRGRTCPPTFARPCWH